MSQVRLKVNEVPKFPYVGIPINLSVQLIKDSRLVCGESTPIAVKLLLVDDDDVANECIDDIMTIQGDLSISEGGDASFAVSINEASMRYENRSFALEVSVLGKLSDEVEPLRTDRMFVVIYRLCIEGPVPSLFYKDLGGKDSCVEFGVSLRDYKNEIVRTRKVPLRAVLMYENGNYAPDQSILRVVGDTRQLSIDTSTGHTHLKLRINEVSRSHQKQNFVICVCPDTLAHPLMNDIAPDQTTPIDVMSKPRPPKTVGAGAVGQKRGAAEYDADDDNGSHKAARIVESAMSHTRPSRTQVESILQNIPPCDSAKAAGVFAGLMDWARMTIDEISHLRWRQIGYETMGEGVPSQPLYERRNPNFAIDELISKYNDFALPTLALLHRDVFQSLEEGSPLPGSSDFPQEGAEPSLQRTLSATAVQHLYGNLDNNIEDSDTAIGSDDEVNQMAPPLLSAQHSLISLPDDWPSLDRITTLDMESLTRNPN